MKKIILKTNFKKIKILFKLNYLDYHLIYRK